MKAVDHLHPALTHHIVNSLGWGTLRPLQEESIEPILAGKHALLLAPTAAGKTEAAFFPVTAELLTTAAAVPEPTVNTATCRAKCDVPEVEKQGDYAIVNANDPNDFVGTTRFPRGGKVFFVKKNPFKYSYKITRRDRSIEAGIIQAFLGHIFGADIGELGGVPVPGLKLLMLPPVQTRIRHAEGRMPKILKN